jgi:hypothetical protein
VTNGRHQARSTVIGSPTLARYWGDARRRVEMDSAGCLAASALDVEAEGVHDPMGTGNRRGDEASSCTLAPTASALISFGPKNGGAPRVACGRPRRSLSLAGRCVIVSAQTAASAMEGASPETAIGQIVGKVD